MRFFNRREKKLRAADYVLHRIEVHFAILLLAQFDIRRASRANGMALVFRTNCNCPVRVCKRQPCVVIAAVNLTNDQFDLTALGERSSERKKDTSFAAHSFDIKLIQSLAIREAALFSLSCASIQLPRRTAVAVVAVRHLILHDADAHRMLPHKASLALDCEAVVMFESANAANQPAASVDYNVSHAIIYRSQGPPF